MDQLRCKSPDMAEKELLAYLVAHNLIRCVMAEAVAQPFDAKLAAQLLDPVFQIRPTAVAPPTTVSASTLGGQVGDHALETGISLQFQQRLPARPADGLAPAAGSQSGRRPGRSSSTSCTASPGISVASPRRPIMAAERLHLLRQLRHKNEFPKPSSSQVSCTLASPKPESPRTRPTRRCGARLASSGAGNSAAPFTHAVPRTQPVVGNQLRLGQTRDQWPVTGLEPQPGKYRHACLMAVLMQQRPRIQIQRVASMQRRQTVCRTGMQPAQKPGNSSG